MYSINDLVISGAALLVIGLIIGFIYAQRKAPARQIQKNLEDHLQKLEEQQKDYQNEVTEHFTQTAQLLNQLTDNYHDVHNHLAKGAQLLCGEDASQALKLLNKHEEKEADAEELSSINPPLDYSPKNPLSQGMLSEDFDLDKNDDENIEINRAV